MTEEKILEKETGPSPSDPSDQKESPSSVSPEVLLLKTELLKKIDLFKSLPAHNLRRLVEKSRNILLEKGEVLFEEGSLERIMYIILSGQISIYKGIKNIAVLDQGEYFGEIILIDDLPRSASAKAINKVLLMEIDDNMFQEYIATSSNALFEMMRVFTHRLRNDLEAMTSDMYKLSNFTHDMGNCLISLGAAEVHLAELIHALQGTQEAHKKRKGMDKVQRSIKTMLSVRNNLITMIDQSLACVKKTRAQYVKAKLEVLPLIEETIDEISCHRHLKNKSVKINVESPPKKCLFNYLDIKRVLQNLIINAGYVTEQNGAITIHVKDLKNMFEIRVQDWGSGIPEDIKPLILKESYTSKEDGNGFGLMSCREIIEDHHQGKIGFESKVGKGSTFYFTLPYEG